MEYFLGIFVLTDLATLVLTGICHVMTLCHPNFIPFFVYLFISYYLRHTGC